MSKDKSTLTDSTESCASCSRVPQAGGGVQCVPCVFFPLNDQVIILSSLNFIMVNTQEWHSEVLFLPLIIYSLLSLS